MDIGKKFKVFRKQKRLTQKELASRLQCSQAYISAIENGKRFPSLKLLKKVEENFGISIEWWFEKGGEREILLITHQLIGKLQELSSTNPHFHKHISTRVRKLIQTELNFVEEIIAFLKNSKFQT